jgi:hypothetical protein
MLGTSKNWNHIYQHAANLQEQGFSLIGIEGMAQTRATPAGHRDWMISKTTARREPGARGGIMRRARRLLIIVAGK